MRGEGLPACCKASGRCAHWANPRAAESRADPWCCRPKTTKNRLSRRVAVAKSKISGFLCGWPWVRVCRWSPGVKDVRYARAHRGQRLRREYEQDWSRYAQKTTKNPLTSSKIAENKERGRKLVVFRVPLGQFATNQAATLRKCEAYSRAREAVVGV